MRTIILKLIIGVSGVIVAFINVQASELSPPYSTLSGYVASGIIGAAAADVWPSA